MSRKTYLGETSGIYLGINYARHSWGIECYAMFGTHLESRKYVSNGSDTVSVRESVRAFRRDVLSTGI
jgi:hypothetical protein